jgi:hypothetical protein
MTCGVIYNGLLQFVNRRNRPYDWVLFRGSVRDAPTGPMGGTQWTPDYVTRTPNRPRIGFLKFLNRETYGAHGDVSGKWLSLLCEFLRI